MHTDALILEILKMKYLLTCVALVIVMTMVPMSSGFAQQQATAEQINNFKKAFSVCLEAKDYMVKY